MKTKEETIHSMCMTWRHDYGLIKEQKSNPDFLDLVTSGMTETDRLFLYKQMEQLYNHHIQPLVHQIEELQNGYRLILPNSVEHAEGMLRVANFYLDNRKENGNDS